MVFHCVRAILFTMHYGEIRFSELNVAYEIEATDFDSSRAKSCPQPAVHLPGAQPFMKALN